jgi:hypothetical protein
MMYAFLFQTAGMKAEDEALRDGALVVSEGPNSN